MDPMASVMGVREVVIESTGAVDLAWCFGFPYADFADCGPALAAYARSQDVADRAADLFLAELNRRETEFNFPVLDAAEAVATALREAGPGGPVVLADTQDNPGGGGHGDTTGLLAELIRQGANGAVVCLINDAESAARCHEAGEGATVRLELGGKSDGAPLPVQARVRKLTDGRFTLTGPMTGGNPANLGQSALIEIEPGVRVVVVSRKMQALDQAILRHVGIEPAEVPVLALKSSVHFRADFGPIASRVIVAAAPGPVVADPATLPFTKLRPGLRLRPGANR
jgi:microcystin degradation protein MlrC